MWKPILAGTVVLAIAGSTFAIAQNRPGRDGQRAWRPNVEDMRAFGEARLAGLKAGLALTAEQEKAWPAFEQAARDYIKLRIDRRSASTTPGPSRQTDPAEWMNQRATALMETGAALKKLGEATAPLYSSLDDSQKRRFAALSRLGSFGGERFRGREGRRWRRGDMQRHMQRTEHFDFPSHRAMVPVQGEERL
jgi:hypothetical protein